MGILFWDCHRRIREVYERNLIQYNCSMIIFPTQGPVRKTRFLKAVKELWHVCLVKTFLLLKEWGLCRRIFSQTKHSVTHIIWITTLPTRTPLRTHTHAKITLRDRVGQYRYKSATAANKGFYTVVLELDLFVVFHRWQMFRSETWVVYLDTISKLPFSLLIVAKEKFTKKIKFLVIKSKEI